MKTTKILTILRLLRRYSGRIRSGCRAILVVALGLTLCVAKVSEAVEMGTAFTYQGRLIDANSAADGLYDLQFKLFDDPNIIIGNQVGGDVTVPDVDVIDGYFTVLLDFNDPNAFNGDARWLEIGVRDYDPCDVNAFTTLSPRQELTPTPYAIYAQSDNDWMVSGSNMYSIPSGNVGIGTTSPSTALEIKGSHVTNRGLLYINATGDGEGHACAFLNGTGQYNSAIVFTRNGDLKWQINNQGDDNDKFHIKKAGPGGIFFTIQRENGNVGIGTDSPGTAKLAVIGGNVGIGTTSPDDFLEIEGNLGGKGIHIDSSSGAGIKLDRANNTCHYKLMFLTNEDEKWAIGNKGRNNNDLGFYAFGATIPRVVFQPNGNVGIGTTSPTEVLDVNGTVRAIAFVGDGSGLTNVPGDSDWTISDSNMYSAVSGNVGIGTTSPTEVLDVNGTVKAESFVGDGSQLTGIKHSGAVYRWASFNTWASGQWSMGNNANMFGGIQPSQWTSGARAFQMSSDKEVLRTLFTRKGYGGKNAMVISERANGYTTTSDAYFVTVLFRIKNTTLAPINWSPQFYYTANGSQGDYASVTLNGANSWQDGGNRPVGSNTTVNLSIPANRTSTVIFVSSAWYWASVGGIYWRDIELGFFNNSLELPPGLVYVDDLDTATGGWEQ